MTIPFRTEMAMARETFQCQATNKRGVRCKTKAQNIYGGKSLCNLHHRHAIEAVLKPRSLPGRTR